MKIGVYDSGVGGISVLHEAMRKLPAPDYLYLADEEHVPYGTKTTEEIRAFASEAVSCLERLGASCVIVACNTASSAAIEVLRERFSFPIIGMEPAVKPAVERAKEIAGARVLVLATPFTVQGTALHDLIDRLQARDMVDLKPMPRLVEFAEKDMFDGDEVEAYLSETLGQEPERRYHTVVLGCTHFNYFLPALKRHVSPETAFADGREGTVKRLSQVMQLPPGEASDASVRDAWKRVTWLRSGIPVEDAEGKARYGHYLERLEELYGTGQ